MRRHSCSRITAIFLAVVGASADPTQIRSKQAQAQHVLAQIGLIDASSSRLSERYNLANVELGRIEHRAGVEPHATSCLRAGISRTRSPPVEAAPSRSTRQRQRIHDLDVLLGAKSLDDLLNRLETIDRVGTQDAQVVRDVRTFKAEVLARKARLTKARARQSTVVASRAEERRSIQGQLASRQRMLASIKTEIAQMRAAEARRQEQLAAQARARLSQQRTLAAQNQADAPVAAFSTGDASSPEVAPSEAIAAAPSSQYGGAAGVAMQFLGVPYVWGGASPSGFDCSGLVMYAFAQVGVSLPHHAASQYGMGVPVSRDALQTGDLVFFNGLEPCGHLHRRRPVRPRAAHWRRGQDLEPLGLVVRVDLGRRSADPLARRRARSISSAKCSCTTRRLSFSVGVISPSSIEKSRGRITKRLICS